MIANHVGQDTPQSSIVLGCDQPTTGYHETNFSMAYSSYISWQSPESPVPLELYPALAWDNLFDNRGALLNLSVLDRVKDRAADLSRKISAGDRSKLDEYLTSVREVEKRVEIMRKGMNDAQDNAKTRNTSLAVMERPANGLPDDLREHAKLMNDIIAIAFQTDKTRVASLILSRDMSTMYYPFLNVKFSHHAASHDNNSDAYESIVRFHTDQYAYLCSKLDAMKEGYDVYVVADAVGGTSKAAHEAALRRIEQAGGKLISKTQLYCELQRDWNRQDTVPGFMNVFQNWDGSNPEKDFKD